MAPQPLLSRKRGSQAYSSGIGGVGSAWICCSKSTADAFGCNGSHQDSRTCWHQKHAVQSPAKHSAILSCCTSTEVLRRLVFASQDTPYICCRPSMQRPAATACMQQCREWRTVWRQRWPLLAPSGASRSHFHIIPSGRSCCPPKQVTLLLLAPAEPAPVLLPLVC